MSLLHLVADFVANPWLIVLASVVLILASLFLYLVYSGLFSKVEISTREPVHGALTICYKTGRGPYKNTGTFTLTLDLKHSH